MNQKEYLDLINFSLKEMDFGYYYKSLEKFERIVKSDFFHKLNEKDRLFIKKRISWIQLSLGLYNQGWLNFQYNWYKNIKKFIEIKKKNQTIKYLINLNQIKKNEKLLIWNDGGFGDFIYQLRLLKYFQKKIYFKVYTSKMDHLLKNKKIITKTPKEFDWHLPLNEIPRIICFNPREHFNFEYNYLIKPSKKFTDYKNYVAITYKTETSINKSIPYQLLQYLFIEKKDIEFLVLQNKLNEGEKSFFSTFNNVTYINKIDNSFIFEDTYSIIDSVRFVISIDTAITHIAGYLGKKNILLLRHPSSFYWGYKDTKSSDYKNHIIIRQKKTGDWIGVLKELLNLIK